MLADAIDRRFFREQYDARQLLASVAQRARNVGDVAAFARLLTVVLHITGITLPVWIGYPSVTLMGAFNGPGPCGPGGVADGEGVRRTPVQTSVSARPFFQSSWLRPMRTSPETFEDLILERNHLVSRLHANPGRAGMHESSEHQREHNTKHHGHTPASSIQAPVFMDVCGRRAVSASGTRGGWAVNRHRFSGRLRELEDQPQ